jgi:carbohydrate-selective porin OprB
MAFPDRFGWYPADLVGNVRFVIRCPGRESAGKSRQLRQIHLALEIATLLGIDRTKRQSVPTNQGRLSLRSICFARSIFIANFIRLACLEIDIAHGQQPSLSPVSDWLSGDGITGTWGGLRSKLTDRGFEFIGSYDAEIWDNTKGGLESGSVYTGLLDFGLKLDLEKALGWRGASLSTTWLLLSGKNASEDLVGNFLTISNNAGFNTLRNYELWFQQNLLDDKISIRLGQIAGDTEFVTSAMPPYS